MKAQAAVWKIFLYGGFAMLIASVDVNSNTSSEETLRRIIYLAMRI